MGDPQRIFRIGEAESTQQTVGHEMILPHFEVERLSIEALHRKVEIGPFEFTRGFLEVVDEFEERFVLQLLEVPTDLVGIEFRLLGVDSSAVGTQAVQQT